MEVKKTEKASLGNKRLLFTEIGFVLALLIVYGAFEYSTKDKQTKTLEAEVQAVEEEEMIPITQETPPPPPEVPDIPVLSDNIDIVDDDLQVEDTFLNLEDDASLGVEIKEYVEVVEEEVIEEEAIPCSIPKSPRKTVSRAEYCFSSW